MSSPVAYPIVGVRTGCRWPARKEIDEFMDPANFRQIVLFLVGLDIMQSRSMEHPLSYFQLAGIHGYPDRLWPSGRTGIPGEGLYCEHSNPGGRFASWHRVYVLLFEQALHDIIMELVDPSTPNTISPIPVEERPNWLPAAQTWRLPYWDFALRRENNDNHICLPDIALFDTNPLSDTNGPYNPTIPTPLIPYRADNPLYAFRYPLKPPKKLEDYGMTNIVKGNKTLVPLLIQTRTVRYAPAWKEDTASIETIWKKGISNISALKEKYQALTADFRENLCTVLTETTTFPQFTMGTTELMIHLPNLGNLHGRMHVTTGGGMDKKYDGNMSHVPSAGMDPIFFLYHAGIDRLIALWQAAHPDETNPDNWLPAADDVTPLLPFQTKNGDFWISKNTRDWSKLGYTYEGLETIHDVESLSEYVDKLYGDWEIKLPIRGERPPGTLPAIPVAAPDYIFTAQYQPNELGAWGIKINLDHDGTIYELGTIINFVNPLTANCKNCERHREEGTTLTSSTFITPALRDLYGRGLLGIEEFTPEYIEPLLAAELKWELLGLDGPSVEYSLGDLTSLKVGVSRRDKELLRGEPEAGLPSYRSPTKAVGYVPLRGITAGKGAGLGEGEDFDVLG